MTLDQILERTKPYADWSSRWAYRRADHRFQCWLTTTTSTLAADTARVDAFTGICQLLHGEWLLPAAPTLQLLRATTTVRSVTNW